MLEAPPRSVQAYKGFQPMPTFAYEALTADGKRSSGEIDAPDRNAAIAEVRRHGLRPTKVAEVQAGSPAAAAAAQRAVSPTQATGGPKRKTGRVSAQTLADFASQFAVLQDAGLPIVRSLKVLANQQKPGLFKAVLEDVMESVESGSTLSDALGQHPKTFDALFCNMVRAGEAGGVLDVILNRVATFLEKAQRLKKKVVGASVYPIVVMSVAILILAAIIIFVVPSFEEMFKSQGLELPAPTQFLLTVSRFIGDPLYGGLMLGGIIGFFLGYGAFTRTKPGKKFNDKVKLSVPIIGTIVRKSTTSRFCRTLGTLVTSGVPILEALEICRNAINNEVLGVAIDEVRASIKEGESISAPLAKTSLFDDIVVNMIDVGEETGELDKMLIKVADNYDLEVDIAVEALMSVMEPILIVFMGSTIGFIVVALFLPLVSMIQNIGGAA